MKKILFIIAAAIITLVSCEKSFDVTNTGNPSGEDMAAKIKADPTFMGSYVSSFYSSLVAYGGAHDMYGLLSILLNLDHMGADIVHDGTPNWGKYDYVHDYGLDEWGRTAQFWNTFYTLIGKCNEVIDFVPAGEDPELPLVRGYLGQAYALRAFSYTYLMLIYQDIIDESGNLRLDAPAVPLVYAVRDEISADVAQERQGRNNIELVMEHIEENFALALPLLEGYERASKMEVNYTVAQGFAARYYLLTQQWEKAAQAAELAAQGYDIMDKARLYSGFMNVEDTEVMWGFNHTTETQTAYASYFSHMSNTSSGYGGIGQMVKCIDKSLYDQIPATDFRKGLFNGPEGNPEAATEGAKYPYANLKFGYDSQWLQDYIFMRASEMYLIKAEALARTGANSDAAAAMKPLMAKRDLGYTKSSVTVEDVLLQRRIELWGEGFVYFDLRRNGLDCIRVYEGSNHPEWARKDYPAHGDTWNFQIPLKEVQENTMIGDEDQNPWSSGA